MATISVCMIVKDEEENLGLCLDCLKDLADEIVIVDTGSTDRTKAIAKTYTDRVYDFLWTGDFSAARNFAFSLARMDYIYSADADERIDEINRQRFRILKEALLPEVEIVQMRYANQLEKGGVYNFDEEYRPKLFKRLRTWRWVSPIHETVITIPVVFDSDVVIGHYPKERHADRDLNTFARVAQTGRLDARLEHMYAMELYIAGEDRHFQAAQAYFQNALEDDSRGSDAQKEAACIVAHAARLGNDERLFYKAALMGVVGTPCAEMYCEVGELYFYQARWKEAIPWYTAAVNGVDCYLTVKASGVWPMTRLAQCFTHLGQAEQAAFWQDAADRWRPPAVEDHPY